MGSFILIKRMKRELTLDEKREVVAYWENHPALLTHEVALYFEEKLKMPVTDMCIVSALISKELGHLG